MREQFGAAIAFVSAEWQRFDAEFAGRDTSFSLEQRIDAFMRRPLAAELDVRFPEIAAFGAEADALTEMRGNTRAAFILIVGEALIAAGAGTRGAIRAALPD